MDNLKAGLWVNDKSEPQIAICNNISECIEIVDKLLKIASRFGGEVFGDYVRRVIIPRLHLKTVECFKEVSLLFRSESKVTEFIDETKFIFGIFCKEYEFVRTLNYGKGKQTYFLSKNNENMLTFHVFYSETFPSFEFDVDRVACAYNVTSGNIDFHGYRAHSAHENIFEDQLALKARLLTQMSNKQAKILDSYTRDIVGADGAKDNEFIKKVNESFNGWTISCFYGQQLPPTIDDIWLQNVFKPTAKMYFRMKDGEVSEARRQASNS